MGRRTQSTGIRLLEAIGLAAGTAAATAAWWITYSNLFINHQVPLRKSIEADLRNIDSENSGLISFYSTQEASGRPLLLVHSVNAAASSYEMGPIFSRYRSRRPVTAIDLPGFGFSERSNRQYSPRLYHEAILDLISSQFTVPVDVVALSLGCEFAARAALIEPERFHSLTFISPSGFSAARQMTSSQRAGRQGNTSSAYRLLSTRLWGRPLYDLIVTRQSIRFFLKQSFVGSVPEDMVSYSHATAHQPGAQYAPLYFLSGALFTPNILPAFYNRLEQPVLVLYDKDAYTGFDRLPQVLESRKNWQAARIIPTRGLAHFERMDDVAAELDRFWSGMS